MAFKKKSTAKTVGSRAKAPAKKKAVAKSKAREERKGEPRAFTVTQLLDKGIEANVAQHARRSVETMHTLRGGSAGAIIDGEQFGCVRKAALRYYGYDLPLDKQTQILMKFGLVGEEVVTSFLANVWPADRIVREEEIPVRYNIQDELVTGRPDAVLLDELYNPFHGVEYKLKGTYYGANNILLNSKVDTDHIIQAMHYMWKLRLKRYSIIYIIPVRFAVQERDAAAFLATKSAVLRPSDGAPQYANLGFYETIFEDTGDKLVSYTVHSGIERELELRPEHIEAFYSRVADVAHKRTLGDRPTKSSLIPGQKEWDKCSSCPLKSTCDSYENNIDAWWDYAIQTISTEWLNIWPNLHPQFLDSWGVELDDGDDK